ncbi:MAG: glycosyltransferase family 2 protein [Pikeienuella sp.]
MQNPNPKSTPVKATLIACARDEGPFLAEWVAYHRLIGFTNILVYSNDCHDRSDDLLTALANQGELLHTRLVLAPGISPQKEALKHAMTCPEYTGADWIMTLDIDEHLNIRCGNGLLTDLITATRADAISVSELFFQPENLTDLRDLTIERHKNREPLQQRTPEKRGVKTLFRPAQGMVIGVHRPRVGPTPPRHWVDGSGAPVSEDFVKTVRHGFVAKDTHRLASINHYALRSPGAFLVKQARGDAWHPNANRFTGRYWRERALSGATEQTIQRFAPKISAKLAEWRTNDTFATAEADSQTAWSKRAAALVRSRKGLALASIVRRQTAPVVRLVTCIKNEAPFLIEWVAWHLWLGVTDFLVYTNDCDDGTDEILARLGEMGLAIRMANGAPRDGNMQYPALAHALKSGLLDSADWVISLDVDEFLRVKSGNGQLTDLFAATPNASYISICEVLFGDSARDTYEPGKVTQQFTRRQSMRPGKWKARRGVKTLFRPGADIAVFHTHRPILTDGASPTWLDGSGIPVPPGFATGDENGIDCRGRSNLAVIHHYTIKSSEDFVAKAARGDVVFPERRLGARYLRQRNANGEDDHSLTEWPEGALDIYNQLITDPTLSQLHNAACAFYQNRITTLRDDPNYADLWQLTDGETP